MNMQHQGDLIVDEFLDQTGQVTGTTYVRSGGHLVAHGQLAGGLIVDQGGRAEIHGQVSRNVINHGHLQLFGQVVGRIIGNQPVNTLEREQVVGTDLEVPFGGTSTSWTMKG